MERQRGIKGLSIVALLIAIVGLSIAFAALSQTLTINGTAKVMASEWEVFITSATANTPIGTAVDNSTLDIDSSSTTTATCASYDPNCVIVSGINVTLKQPNDEVSFDFVVKNSGSIDAYLDHMTVGGSTTVDATNYSSLSSTILNAATYKDDSTNDADAADIAKLKQTMIVNIQEVTATSPSVTLGNVGFGTTSGLLAKNNTTKTFRITVKLDNFSDASLFPSEDVTVTLPAIQLYYSQV